jgi:hypothetical protein
MSETSSMSCDQAGFVDQAADMSLSADGVARRGDRRASRRRPERRSAGRDHCPVPGACPPGCECPVAGHAPAARRRRPPCPEQHVRPAASVHVTEGYTYIRGGMLAIRAGVHSPVGCVLRICRIRAAHLQIGRGLFRVQCAWSWVATGGNKWTRSQIPVVTGSSRPSTRSKTGSGAS